VNNGMRLCALDDIEDGASRGFDPRATGRDTMFVVRRGAQVHAYVNDCPHWPGTPLPWRRHEYLSGDRQHIACSGHGARFEIDTGTCVLGPCLGQALAPLPVRVAHDGGVHLIA
jgi:nitrite reductase/ring-hydroxylating ferredoxin subunit